MMVLKLKAEKRNLAEKAKTLRKAGKMPAVFYGGKSESTPIVLLKSEFQKIWKQAGESSIISLEGVGEDKEVLIQDIDKDPVSEEPRHADFYVIEKGKKIEVSVPLEFIGVSPAVKELGGILIKVMREMEIEVMPKDLPQHIEVDISSLVELDSQISVKDLNLPEGVVSLNGLDEVVAAISEAKEELEPEPVAADLSAIEVEKKGKEAKEGEEKVQAENPKEEKK